MDRVCDRCGEFGATSETALTLSGKASPFPQQPWDLALGNLVGWISVWTTGLRSVTICGCDYMISPHESGKLVCLPACCVLLSSREQHIGGPASRRWVQGWMDEVEQGWGKGQGSLDKLIASISQTGVLRLRMLKGLVLSPTASGWVFPKPCALSRQFTPSWRDPGACVHIGDPLLTAVNHTAIMPVRGGRHVPTLTLHQGFPDHQQPPLEAWTSHHVRNIPQRV